MKPYFDDILVWTIIGAILIPTYFALFKRKRAFIFIFGLLLMLGSVPAGIMLEISVNFGETRIWGIGYFLMFAMFVTGLVVAIKAVRQKNNSKQS